MRFISRAGKCTSHQNALCKGRLAGEDCSAPNRRCLSHLTPRANFPVGCVQAVPEEAWLRTRRAGLTAVGAAGGGLGGSVQVRRPAGGYHGAEDNTLLEANTTAGRALSRTQINRH